MARGLLALAPAALSACYHYVPLQASPDPGVQVQVELNDAGRVGMTNAVGAEVGSIQGVVESRSDTGLVVSVAQVIGEYGGVTRWEGERVAIKPEYIRSMGERRFSAGRTAIVAAAVGTGLVVFVVTRNLLGLGGQPSSTDGNGGHTQ